MPEGDKLHAERDKAACRRGQAVCRREKAVGRRDKLHAEGDKLYAEGSKLWAERVHPLVVMLCSRSTGMWRSMVDGGVLWRVLLTGEK